MTQALDQFRHWLNALSADEPISVPETISRFPCILDHSDLIEELFIEAFVRQVDQGQLPSLSEFLGCVEVSPQLRSRLRNAVRIHNAIRPPEPQLPLSSNYPKTGDTLCGFLLLREVGRGAFSTVFLAAEHQVADRRVLVKVCSDVEREVRLLASLSHPQVPRVLSVQHDRSTGLQVLAMEYRGTKTLLDVISHDTPGHFAASSGRRLATRHSNLVDLILQVASVLDFIHSNGILHLDLKPNNIVICDDGQPLLIDFNLATSVHETGSLSFRGTLLYAAPEIVASAVHGRFTDVAIAASADVFSLGAILFELLTNETPVVLRKSTASTSTAQQVLDAYSGGGLDIAGRLMSFSEPLVRVLECALAPDPTKRYQTARAFRDALRDAVSDRAVAGTFRGRGGLIVCVLLVLIGILFVDVPATFNEGLQRVVPVDRDAELGVAGSVVSIEPVTVHGVPDRMSCHDRYVEVVTALISGDYRVAMSMLEEEREWDDISDESVAVIRAYTALQLHEHSKCRAILSDYVNADSCADSLLFLAAMCEFDCFAATGELPNSHFQLRLASLKTEDAVRLTGVLRSLQRALRGTRAGDTPAARLNEGTASAVACGVPTDGHPLPSIGQLRDCGIELWSIGADRVAAK